MDDEDKIRILLISTIAIFSVVLVEISLGLLVGSLAIASDGVHALLDAMSMFILLLTTRASMKPPDEEHMYGHEKIESLGGFIGGIILLGAAAFLALESILKIIRNDLYIVQEWKFAGFAAIAYTICIDILRVRVLRKPVKESATIQAGFYHAIADLGSTLVALFGFGFAVIGFQFSDALASIVLSIAIGYLSMKLAWSSGMELSDAVSMDIVEKVRREVASTEGVSNIKTLKVRRAGNKVFVEVAVQAPDYLSFDDSHALASKIEDKLKKCFEASDVVVHVEPLQREMITGHFIEKLAGEVEGVKDVHEVNVTYANGKLYVTLHARVDPDLSVQEAHNVAEKIEKKLRKAVDNIAHVTVHVEPVEDKMRGPIAGDKEIRQAVHEAIRSFQNVLSLKGLTTYVTGGRRYINLECCFKARITIDEAHRIASEIENNVKKRVMETAVTVHIEPAEE
ncbi:MAG: cation-efflux pump [Nitrososphaerota archaeon]|nr:cation-efflux pump [Candidatus Bathyarchaeota archaeon]MDW8193971.1 cation-efflux pump [Nitrososphaerota archaeon]